jgi:hypothetical protein
MIGSIVDFARWLPPRSRAAMSRERYGGRGRTRILVGRLGYITLHRIEKVLGVFFGYSQGFNAALGLRRPDSRVGRLRGRAFRRARASLERSQGALGASRFHPCPVAGEEWNRTRIGTD